MYLILVFLSLWLLDAVLALSANSVASTTLKKQFFATTVPGLEHILSDEISLLSDASNIQITSAGVSFQGTIQTGLEALLYSRTALKLMEKLQDGRGLKTKDDLYDLCSSIDWSQHIDIKNTIKCDAIMGLGNPTTLSHSHFNSLTMKNAIVDQFRTNLGQRPSVELDDPDVSLLMYLHKSNAVIYKVWSGEASLHKRGYRDTIHKAALRETTAAALIYAMGLEKRSLTDPDIVIFDPMCGSGTLAIEAALILTHCAPGLLRYGSHTPGATYGYDRRSPPVVVDRWLDGETTAATWNQLYARAQSLDLRASVKKENRPKQIYLNDIHPGAIDLAVKCAEKAGVRHMLQFCTADIRDLDLRGSRSKPALPKAIITNPPWDLRLDGEGVADSWYALNEFADRNIHDDGGQLWTLSGDPKLQNNIQLPILKTMKFSSAGMDVQLMCHEVGAL